MTLIPEWRQSWRFFSQQAMVLALAAQGAWQAMPPELKASVPDWGVHAMTAVILVAGIFGRLVRQK